MVKQTSARRSFKAKMTERDEILQDIWRYRPNESPSCAPNDVGDQENQPPIVNATEHDEPPLCEEPIFPLDHCPSLEMKNAVLLTSLLGSFDCGTSPTAV